MAISAEKKVAMVKNGEIVDFKRVHYGEMFLWSGALKIYSSKPIPVINLKERYYNISIIWKGAVPILYMIKSCKIKIWVIPY